jgi:DGQHR domain-containing protein
MPPSSRPRAASTINKTSDFDFLFGRYSHSGKTIPYFQISMSFPHAASNLMLISDMPGSASLNWKIEELFQRDIDWERVEHGIIPYLKQDNQSQFFNSLTIALLPIYDDKITTYSADKPWAAPELDNKNDFSGGMTVNFGPLTCGYWEAWDKPGDRTAKLGRMSWNIDQMCGVAIDGQHRLAAIKELVNPGSSPYTDSSIPVIFIVLDEKLGANLTSTRDELLPVLRGLFIDLNKNAEKVKRSRQILLDDREPTSICVRSLVGKSLCGGQQELEEETPRMPLSLIDWHSDSAKFDDGPYLSTILGLDYTIAKILDIKPLDDPMDWTALRKNCDKLEKKLPIDLSRAMARLDHCEDMEEPFGFEQPNAEEEKAGEMDELQVISEAFAKKYAAPIIHLLSKFSPYENFINLRSEENTLTPEFANWYAQYASSLKTKSSKAKEIFSYFEAGLRTRATPISTKNFRDAVKKLQDHKDADVNDLAFTVVFQKSLILAWRRLLSISDKMINDSLINEEETDIEFTTDEETEESTESVNSTVELTRAKQLIAPLNKLATNTDFLWRSCQVPKGDGHDLFWHSSLMSANHTIDFTNTAASKASDWLVLVGYLGFYKDSTSSDLETLWTTWEQAADGLDLKVGQCLERLKNTVGDAILVSRDERYDTKTEDEKKILRDEEIRPRAEWIWNNL